MVALVGAGWSTLLGRPGPRRGAAVMLARSTCSDNLGRPGPRLGTGATSTATGEFVFSSLGAGEGRPCWADAILDISEGFLALLHVPDASRLGVAAIRGDS